MIASIHPTQTLMQRRASLAGGGTLRDACRAPARARLLAALRRRAAQGRLRLSRRDRRLRLDLVARAGPQGAGASAQRPSGHQLCRERQGRRERRSGDEGPRPAGQQAHLHHLLRLHGPDARGRQGVSRRQMGALHRLQARRQRRHLQLALLSGPSGDRHDRRHDVEDGRDRLCRVVQDPGSGDGRERLHACRRRRSTRRSPPSW